MTRAASSPDVIDEVALPPRLRPALRGTLHRWAVPVALVLTVLLTVRASGAGDRAAVLVYGLGVTAMLATSGLYHDARLAHRDRRVLRRLDHSMILVCIAGTYTAVIVLALDGTTAGGPAVRGVGTRHRRRVDPHALDARTVGAGHRGLPRVRVADHARLPGVRGRADGGELALLAVGGGLYSVGAVVYALKWPNPWPAVFGYHEVFHTLVVAAAIVPLGRHLAARRLTRAVPGSHAPSDR